jgi:hypothetical protein
MKKIITVWMMVFAISTATTFEWKAQSSDVKLIDKKLWQDMPVNKKEMLSWYKADAYCRDLEVLYAGFKLRDFGLPTVKELKKLNETKDFERFEYKQYGNYWSSEKFIERKREYAYFVGYANDGFVDKFPIKFSQQVRCIYEGNLPVTQEMSLEKIAQEIVRETKEQEIQKNKIAKPVKPAYITEQKLKKDEFEKSNTFAKRVDEEKRRVRKLNAEIDKAYDIEIKAWQEASKKAYLEHNAHNTTTQNQKYLREALAKAMHFKYGSPRIESATYDADEEIFNIVVFSTKAKKGKEGIGVNMIDAPVYSKKGIFSIERIENISEDTTKIMLQFHKKPRRSMYFGHYKKVVLYDANDDKTYTRTYYDDGWSVSRGDKVSIYVPRLNETIYRAPFGYMLKRRVIRLNEASYPLYKLSLNIPVKLAYAKKFKSLLLSKEFKPTVEMNIVDGKVDTVGIVEIKDPETFVIENAYQKAKGDIKALESFLAKYDATPFSLIAQEELAALKKEKAQQAQREAAYIEEEKAKKAKIASEKYEAYHKVKKVGDKVCMEGKMLLFMSVNVSGYVEAVQNSKIQIRIADTEGQTPNYHGTTLRQGTIIWDEYDRWKGCD